VAQAIEEIHELFQLPTMAGGFVYIKLRLYLGKQFGQCIDELLQKVVNKTYVRVFIIDPNA
jgi:hypothetical protein